jgi:hypothetical protein
MPAVSKKQKQFMDAAAHNPAFAKKAGIPQSVAMDFSKASKGRKFREGGDTMHKMKKGDKASGMHKMPDGKMMKDSAMKKMAHGGMVAGVGQSQGQTLNQNVKKLEGDKVAVRGVGAARARTAMIF